MLSPPFAVSVGDSLQTGFDRFFAFLPNLLGFLVILVIGYVVARVGKGILTKLLTRVGLDRQLGQSPAGQYVEKAGSPSALIASVAFWLIFLGALSLAAGTLQIQLLQDFVAAIFAFLPKVIAALLIILVAGALAGAVGGLVQKTMGETPTGKIVKTVVPSVIMAIAAFMILDQLEIAPQIVTITFAALMGALALGLALAFGLGGRTVAERMLEGAYQSGQQQREQVRQDVQTGKERGQQQAQEAKARVAQGCPDGSYDDQQGERLRPADGEGGRSVAGPRDGRYDPSSGVTGERRGRR